MEKRPRSLVGSCHRLPFGHNFPLSTWPRRCVALFCTFSHFLSVFISACYFLLLRQALTSHSAGIIFFSLVLAVFFATGAGIIRGVTPFRGTSCGKAANLYPVIWQPFVGECRRIVSIQAIAWTLCTFFGGEVVRYSMLKLCCRGTVHVHAIRYPRVQVRSSGQAHARWILRTLCSLGSQRGSLPLDARRALPHLLLILPPRLTSCPLPFQN